MLRRTAFADLIERIGNMAYSSGDTMIIVRGQTAGTEEWSNTWCVNRGATAVQTVVDLFRAFYDAIFAGASNLYSTGTTASQVRVRDLFGGSDLAADWDPVAGSGGDNALPSECAIRISIGAAPNRHGGPFLPAPNISSLNPDGYVGGATQAEIRDALQDLVDGLFAEDVTLRLNSPDDELLHLALSVRVGQVFDAMRSRRSDLAEGYVAVSMP